MVVIFLSFTSGKTSDLFCRHYEKHSMQKLIKHTIIQFFLNRLYTGKESVSKQRERSNRCRLTGLEISARKLSRIYCDILTTAGIFPRNRQLLTGKVIKQILVT